MEQRGDVQQLGVERDVATLPEDRRKREHAHRVAEQQLRFAGAHDRGGLACHRAIGNPDAGDTGAHVRVPRGVAAVA
ncbi:hypothetical protein [Burkholderia multivorans]|uniref:hypothetical protein n=1 Tax=Burkholderia multivorans TaxID=87883 RepID=UPI00345EFF87